MGNYYSDDDSLQRSQGAIDGPAFQRPQASPYQRPWYAGTDSRDERTGVEMAQERQRQADQAGVSPNDPVQRLIRFGVVGSSGAGPQGIPSPRDMPKALAAESQGRFGGQDMSRLQNLDTGFGTFLTGRGGAMPDSSGGGFVRGNTAYNVNDTSQAGIQRVTARGTSPLYTNIKPEDAVAGPNNQMIGQPADEARLGLDRYQRMAPQQPWGDAPMGSTQHGLYQLDVMRQLQDSSPQQVQYSPPEKTQAELENEEKTRRWRQDELIEMAKRNPHLQNVIGHIIQTNSAQNINQNNVAGRMNELGLQGRNQLAAEEMRQRGALGLEGLRRAGRKEELSQQGADHWALQNARIEAEAPYRNAQAGYYGAQMRKLDEDSEYGKSELGMFQKLVDSYLKTGLSPKEAQQEAARGLAAAQKGAKLKKEGEAVGYGSGGYIGYADGGAVQPMSAAEKLLAEMDAKYGKTAGSAPAPAPQPAPAPPPVQQPQGIADRFRGYFGSPDTRMKQNGLAFGGAVPAQDVPGGRAVAQAVAGRQVFGQSDGSGRDDALPAVIDGERPAALTSGEFVWPVHAVKYFGMAKLNKMLAEAEKGMAPQDEPA